ncbi:MAG: electron transfer flavoprotein subunit alpha/FixB family protein [Dehalococcoidia bacterium]|jgi:electron transfer flavoprotein alpha subunit|nr:MAG: electron transfer flavoprotein alpha subunit [Chloroflexota bacterium]|tara:strand:- start:7741 stop:8709 length:969 start_codon:yes stop_codon:yes gene_type:complete
MSKNIMVIGEFDNDQISETTTELLSGATKLSAGGSVSIVLLGTSSDLIASQAFAAGAHKAYISSSGDYDAFLADKWVNAVNDAITKENPDLVLLEQSSIGRDLGPRLAFKLDTGVAMDCVSIEDDDGHFKATRPCFGGNARAVYSFEASPAIATIRAKSFEIMQGDTGTGDIVQIQDTSVSKVTITNREVFTIEGLSLTDAPIVLCGGRGLGGPEGFDMIQALAEAIGTDKAALGSSRAACDLGWFPVANQVGLTGKVVNPDLYIGIAVSGASQHMAGCSGSKTIVAINKDPDANMFKASRWGIVGDYKEVVPALIDAINAK